MTIQEHLSAILHTKQVYFPILQNELFKNHLQQTWGYASLVFTFSTVKYYT